MLEPVKETTTTSNIVRGRKERRVHPMPLGYKSCSRREEIEGVLAVLSAACFLPCFFSLSLVNVPKPYALQKTQIVHSR